MRLRRNTWPGQRAAHGVAAHIGWAYRGGRRKKPVAPLAYLGAAGLGAGAIAKYRKARKHTPARLLKRRFARKHGPWRGKPKLMKAAPYLYNTGRRRRAGSYAKFVQAFARRSGLSGPALFKAAARARRGGRSNQGLPGAVSFNRKRKTSRKSKSRRSYRRNAILPYMAFENRGNGRKRKYSRNSILPYAAFNPGDSDPMAALGTAIETTFSMDFWKGTVLPLGAGFIGGQFAGGLVYALAQKIAPAGSIDGAGTIPTVARIGSRAVGAAALSGVAFLATKNRDLAGKVLAGGMVAVLAQVIQEIFGAETYAKMTGMSDIGLFADDLTSDLKQRIANSIRGQMGQMGSFVTTQDMASAPRMGDFVTTQNLQQAPIKAGPPVVTDLSSFSDSVADMMMV